MSETNAGQGLSSENVQKFRRMLAHWYRAHARVLPWRGIDSPFHTWVSEIMLQQTRVNAVMEHYHRFVERFPTVIALALAKEEDVLAAWSGLGYYRRARMLHHAAKFLVAEHNAELPRTAERLRTLPGIGEYTSAAIASIAFGERVAVVDGNVERVLLRITGRPEDTSAAGRAFVREQAQALVPHRDPGDHNQAMMELGATICLPRGPLCSQCPVFDFCLTRGEHVTVPRQKMLSQTVMYSVWTRDWRGERQVLLRKRGREQSQMAGMLELPPLATAPAGNQPILRVRHAITRTNYYVEIYEAPGARPPTGRDLTWVRIGSLEQLALTGLARKVLQRLGMMDGGARSIKNAAAKREETQ